MRVAVLGTGLIGSSVGLAATAAGYGTVGWDLDPVAARRAVASGAFEAAAASCAEALAEADCVVVAAPLAATVALLRDLPPAPRATLIMDVASVKEPVVAAAVFLPNFVATHPIAGSERRGPEAATRDLFRDCTWAYVPPRDPALERRAQTFIGSLGGRPLAVPAARHDAVIAFTSHLPQIVSSALGAMLAERLSDPLIRELSGTGMRSMTRLAASDWSIWGNILEANSGPIAQEVRALLNVLRSVADALEKGAGQPLATLFAQAGLGAGRLHRTPAPPPSFLPSTPTDTDDSR